MALCKEIELPNGVTVRYHRVVRVDTVANVQNTIEVASYTSQEKREQERQSLADQSPFGASAVYLETSFHVAPYDQSMTVAGAYRWLKANVEAFADAEDVLDADDPPTDEVTGDEFVSMIEEVM